MFVRCPWLGSEWRWKLDWSKLGLPPIVSTFINTQHNRVCIQASCVLASSPGPFKKSEKRAWYPLFAHALNFPTFWEFQIIPCYPRVPWRQVRVFCHIFNRILLTMAICVQGLDSAVLYDFLRLRDEAMTLKHDKKASVKHLYLGLIGFGKL